MKQTCFPVLLSLQKDDKLALGLDGKYGDIYSDICYQTSMKGFLYKPVKGEPVSWFVVWSEVNLFFSRYNLFDFPFQKINNCRFTRAHVYVNQGSGLDNVTNHLITPLSEMYYVQLTLTPAYSSSTIELLLSRYPTYDKQRILYVASPKAGYARSRAIILRLQKGEELQVNCQFSRRKYAAVAGFLLYN